MRVGFTVVELMIGVSIIGILAAIAVPSVFRSSTQAKVSKAILDIKEIAADIDIFHLENGRFPDSLAEIKRDKRKDPWGRPYEYLNIETAGKDDKDDTGGKGGKGSKGGNGAKPRKDHSLHPINSGFDLYSKGEDGASNEPLTAKASRDDIIRANDGSFVGLASEY